MRILQVTNAMTIGGSERVAVELTNELARRGHDVALAAGPGPLWDEVAEGVDAFCLRGFPEHKTAGLAVMLTRLRWLVRAWAPDVVAVHQRKLGLCMRVLQVHHRVPVVEYVHSVFSDHRIWSFRNTTTIAIGSGVYDQVLEHYGRPAEQVFHIPLGIVDRRSSVIASKSPSTMSQLRFIGVGRLVPEKDPDYFGALMASIDREGGKVDARWFGAGPMLATVQKRWPAVSWEGEVNNVAEQIAASDALVITSRKEGLPVVALEALSVGRALLCRDVGSCSDAVEDGQSGILWPSCVRPDEVAAELCSKLELANAAAARCTLGEMGRRGRNIYVHSFEISTMVDATVELYEQCRQGSGACSFGRSLEDPPAGLQ